MLLRGLPCCQMFLDTERDMREKGAHARALLAAWLAVEATDEQVEKVLSVALKGAREGKRVVPDDFARLRVVCEEQRNRE